MTKDNKFIIGMQLHKIAMAVDDETLESIRPYLDKIEGIIASEEEEKMQVSGGLNT